MGMCGPEDPLFTPLLPLARVPFQAKESVHKTPFWENLEILASTASIFTQILAHKFWNFQLTSPQILKFSAHKPPNFEIFRSQAPPPFSEANVSSQAPHFGNPGRTPLPEKKLSAPPRTGPLVKSDFFDFSEICVCLFSWFSLFVFVCFVSCVYFLYFFLFILFFSFFFLFFGFVFAYLSQNLWRQYVTSLQRTI